MSVYYSDDVSNKFVDFLLYWTATCIGCIARKRSNTTKFGLVASINDHTGRTSGYQE